MSYNAEPGLFDLDDCTRKITWGKKDRTTHAIVLTTLTLVRMKSDRQEHAYRQIGRINSYF